MTGTGTPMEAVRRWMRGIPVVGPVLRALYRRVRPGATAVPFDRSDRYWEERYARGGDSGVGSYGKFAEFKAEILNAFVEEHGVETVIELGCGDGNQVALATYPRYIGYDVSPTAITACRERFSADKTREFFLLESYDGRRADLTISLDVIYHLVEHDVFVSYMHRLFDAAVRYVIIYSSDTDDNQGYEDTHVRHRVFTTWVRQHRPDWRLLQRIPNRYPFTGDYRTGSFADFFVFEKKASAGPGGPREGDVGR